MHFPRLARVSLVSSLCLITGLIGTRATGGRELVNNPRAQLELQQLQVDFHAAGTLGDEELMRSLWAEDAVFFGPRGPVVGPDAITAFFIGGEWWGEAASLAPTYKTWFEVDGNEAAGQFECILVEVRGSSPLTTPLSAIPFGSQNPDVEIVQHSTATVTAVKRRGRWLLHTFRGSAGPVR